MTAAQVPSVGPSRWIDRILGLYLPAALAGILWLAWLVDGIWGVSYPLILTLGIASAALVVVGVGSAVIQDPSMLARPIVVFAAGALYFFLMDMAVMREMEDFPFRIVLITYTLCDLFVLLSLLSWYLIRMDRSPFEWFLRTGDMALSGNMFFWLAIATFGMELGKRVALAGGDVSLVAWEMFQSRAIGTEGGVTVRGTEGDWRVLLEPIGVLFLGVPYLADRAVLRGINSSRKVILVGVVVSQLAMQALSGNRSYVVMSLVLPIFARAAEHRKNLKRMLWILVLSTFALAPLLDVMVRVRGYGWSNLDKVEDVSWNVAQAHRDDNLYWIANLVDFVDHRDGTLSYKGPLGFVDGLGEVGMFWCISFIPRAIWPNKPQATELQDDTRTWNVSSAAVGDLFRSGGMSFLIVGAILFGAVVRSLEPLYRMRKQDGALLEYAYLLLILLFQIRALTAFQFGPFAFMVLWATCAMLGRRQKRMVPAGAGGLRA